MSPKGPSWFAKNRASWGVAPVRGVHVPTLRSSQGASTNNTQCDTWGGVISSWLSPLPLSHTITIRLLLQLLSSYTPVWTKIINDNTSFQTSHAQPPVSWSGPLKPIRQQVLTTRRKPSLLGQLRQRWLKMFHWFSLNHYVIEQRPVCLELKPCLKAFSSCNFSRRVVEIFHIAWPRRRSMRPRVGLFCMLPYGLRKRNSPWANAGVEMTFADLPKPWLPK